MRAWTLASRTRSSAAGSGPESSIANGIGVNPSAASRCRTPTRAVSSTAIREAVTLGDLDGAARMLGRPVSVLGLVVHGDNLGARIGFPTANLDLHHELHPPRGVYACRARLPRETGAVELDGVANIGFRPTVAEEAPDRLRIEVHLFDFEEDIYGQRVELEFCARLRGEQRFAGVEELTAQIRRDVERARELLATTPRQG